MLKIKSDQLFFTVMKKILLPMFLVIPISVATSAHSFDYVLGTGMYSRIADPSAVPAKGTAGAFVSPNFHTTITKVSEKATDNYNGTDAMSLYGPSGPMTNCDDTYLTVHANSGDWDVYTGPKHPTPYVKVGVIPWVSISDPNTGGTFSPNTPWWSGTDPHIVYALGHWMLQTRATGPVLYKVTVSYSNGVGSITSDVEHDFRNDTIQDVPGPSGGDAGVRRALNWFFTGSNAIPNLSNYSDKYYLDTGEYGSHSFDIRYTDITLYKAVPGGNPQMVGVIQYDYKTHSVVNYTQNCALVNCGMWKGLNAPSPLGTYHVLGSPNANGGLNVVSKDFTTLVQFIPGFTGHGSGGISAAGREIFFGQDWLAVDLETGTQYCWGNWVIGGSASGGQHYSMHHGLNKPGWGLVEAYMADDLSWFSNQLLLVELDMDPARVYWTQPAGGARQYNTPTNPNRVWRLTFTHTISGVDTIGSQPMGTTSQSGLYGYWTSAWDRQGNYEVYQVSLPSTWWSDLGGSLSIPPLRPPPLPPHLKTR